VTDEIHYLSAIEEGAFVIAQANATARQDRQAERRAGFLPVQERVHALHRRQWSSSWTWRTAQIVSVRGVADPSGTRRRQPCLDGLETCSARRFPACAREAAGWHRFERTASGRFGTAVLARRGGKSTTSTPNRWSCACTMRETAAGEVGVDIYNLTKLHSQQSEHQHQPAAAGVGSADIIAKGDVIADGASTDMGRAGAGADMLVAFMPGRLTTTKTRS